MANRIPSTSPDATSELALSIEPSFAAVSYAASGAIGIKEGVAALTGSSALAMTLVAPTAGLPSAGGDDGKTLHIIGLQAEAHTVTTPANAINGNKHIATFAAIADHVHLTAWNGVWYASDNSTTLS